MLSNGARDDKKSYVHFGRSERYCGREMNYQQTLAQKTGRGTSVSTLSAEATASGNGTSLRSGDVW